MKYYLLKLDKNLDLDEAFLQGIAAESEEDAKAKYLELYLNSGHGICNDIIYHFWKDHLEHPIQKDDPEVIKAFNGNSLYISLFMQREKGKNVKYPKEMCLYILAYYFDNIDIATI